MISSTDIGEVAAALSKAQGEFPKIDKNRVVKVRTRDGGQYEFAYATLDEIFDKVRRPLATNGLAITQQIEPHDKGLSLETRLLHGSGQWLGSVLPVFYHADPQKLGSEITYKRRYAIAALLGVAADEDDDAGAVVGSEQQAAGGDDPPPPQQPTAHRPPPTPTDSARDPAERTRPVSRELIDKRLARIATADDLIEWCAKLPEYAPIAENPAEWPHLAGGLHAVLQQHRSEWPTEAADEAADVLRSIWLAVAAGAVGTLARAEQLLAWCVELREKAPPKQPQQWREIARLVLARTVRQVEAEAWPQKMGDALGDEMRAHTAIYKPLLEAKENHEDTTGTKEETQGEA